MEYLNPLSAQTLTEALKEYYDSRDDLAVGRGMSNEAQEFFRCHDTTHVVFGCATDLSSEACVKMWSFFGTDAGFGRLLAGYKLPESNEIYDTLTVPQILQTTSASFRIVPTVIFRSRRMNKKWPWSDFDAYLNRRLDLIRAEFGIAVVEDT